MNVETNHNKAISIVLNVHNQANELSRNLPVLLSQQYEPGYEVIVVDESSTDDTDEVLAQLKASHPNLYTTYIPASSHYLSRQKLAITLGMKAAHNEWVILTHPGCHPDSEDWLTTMSEKMTDDVDMVCGYTGLDKAAGSFRTFMRIITFSRQKSSTYRYDGANLAIRKSVFMARSGYANNLQFLRGEYDFLVNETPAERIAIVTSTDSFMHQEEPTKKEWTNYNLYYMQTRRHLERAFTSRLVFVVLQTILHLLTLLSIASIVYAIYLQDTIYITITAVIALLLVLIRCFVSYRLVKPFQEPIAVWKYLYLDLLVAWHYAYYQLRYLVTDKSNFIRK